MELTWTCMSCWCLLHHWCWLHSPESQPMVSLSATISYILELQVQAGSDGPKESLPPASKAGDNALCSR